MTIYDFDVVDIKGRVVSLSSYFGKVVMIVNVASKCGYTKQYAGLQKLYDQYKSEGFAVLGFPSNEFAEEEPGSNEEILNFCEQEYDVTFPMFTKTTVLKDNPLYAFLTNGTPIRWNFEKFLIDREGNVVKRFDPKIEPEETEADIKSLL